MQNAVESRHMIGNLIIPFLNIRRSQAKLLKEQWTALKETLEYAYDNVPFYRERFDRAGIIPSDIKTKQDLLKIPVTTKEDLRQHKREFIAAGFQKKKLKTSTSTGSTGEPTTTYFSRADWLLLKHVLKIRSRHQCGFRYGQKLVFIDDRPVETVRKENKKFFNKILRKYSVSVDQPLDEHMRIYRELKPHAFYGMPSYFKELAEYVKQNDIRWLRPEIIFTSSETFDPHDKREMENVLGCKVLDIYGSTEFKEVSWECPLQKGYHINVDTFFVEFVNDNHHVEEGEEGDIIITSLKNKAMPLIRYALEDRGTYSNEQCDCGCHFPLMKKILGRCVDYFTLSNGRRIAPFTLTNTLQDCSADYMEQYQIVQKDYNEVLILIKPNEQFHDQIEEKIIQSFKNVLGQEIDVKTQLVPHIPRERSGKYKVVKSEINERELNKWKGQKM
ncbi:MAG: phenylacetate--CoA ligase family protein [Archaeoglobaceae archaeon]